MVASNAGRLKRFLSAKHGETVEKTGMIPAISVAGVFPTGCGARAPACAWWRQQKRSAARASRTSRIVSNGMLWLPHRGDRWFRRRWSWKSSRRASHPDWPDTSQLPRSPPEFRTSHSVVTREIAATLRRPQADSGERLWRSCAERGNLWKREENRAEKQISRR